MNYIPTQQQRIKIYDKLQNVQQFRGFIENNDDKENDANLMNSYKQQKTNTLNKEQLNNLLTRLTQDNKKQLLLKNQIQKLMVINKEKKIINKRMGKVQERLLQAGKQAELKKQKMRETYQEQQNKQMQNIPSTNQTNKEIRQHLFFERVDELVSQKDILMKKLDEKYCPKFKPVLNSYSLFLAEVNNYDNQKFLGRVAMQQEQRKQKEEQNKRKILEQQMKEVTLRPKLNDRANTKFKVNKEAVNQLQKQKKRGNSSYISKNGSMKNIQTFKPQINSHSLQLLKNREKTQFHERLYKDALIKQETNRKSLNNNFLFKPAINVKSIEMVERKRQRQKSLKINSDDSMDYEEVFIQNSFTGTPLRKQKKQDLRHNNYHNSERTTFS